MWEAAECLRFFGGIDWIRGVQPHRQQSEIRDVNLAPQTALAMSCWVQPSHDNIFLIGACRHWIEKPDLDRRRIEVSFGRIGNAVIGKCID